MVLLIKVEVSDSGTIAKLSSCDRLSSVTDIPSSVFSFSLFIFTRSNQGSVVDPDILLGCRSSMSSEINDVSVLLADVKNLALSFSTDRHQVSLRTPSSTVG